MPVREGQVAGRRRRRTPEAAQREIIAAAEQLLRERPFRELTVDEVMRRTGLSRPSFYVYFKDRHDLVLRLVQHLAAEMLVVANRWYEANHPSPAMLRDALEGCIAVYGEHSAVLRALADAAVDDRDVEAAYGALVEGFVEVTATHIESEIECGADARGAPAGDGEGADLDDRALPVPRVRADEPGAADAGARHDAHRHGAHAVRHAVARRLPGREVQAQRGRARGDGRHAGHRGERQAVPGAQRRGEVDGVGGDAGQQPAARGAAVPAVARTPAADRRVADPERLGEHLRARRDRRREPPIQDAATFSGASTIAVPIARRPAACMRVRDVGSMAGR